MFSEKANSAIHLCDSETDCYALLATLTSNCRRFIIRGCYDPTLSDGNHLRSVLKEKQELFSKKITLSARKKKSGCKTNKRLKKREARSANMSIKAAQINIKRSNLAGNQHPKFLPINVVYLLEKDPPEQENPVEWILLTHEPIDTRENIEKIIEYYCARWIIEEYFKALKTGCSYEKRQLESYETLQICLSIFVPIAWFLLLLRAKSRTADSNPELYVPKDLIGILEEDTKANLRTSEEVLMALAKLGGHIKYNGPPGWLVLWRGLRELAAMKRGFELAQKIYLSRKRCDQS